MKIGVLAGLVLGILREGGPMDVEEIDYQLRRLRRRPGPAEQALGVLEREGKVSRAEWSDGGIVWTAVTGAKLDRGWLKAASPAPEDKATRVLKQMRERVDDDQLIERIDQMIEHQPKPRSEVASAIERIRKGKPPTSYARVFDELAL